MITVYGNMGDIDYPIEWMNFSAGESFFKTPHIPRNVKIVWNYENDAEFFKLGQLIDYFKSQNGNFVDLFIPYFPHSRQDRYSGTGQPFSLKVALKFLNCIISKSERNNLVYNEKVSVRISTLDLHSDVALEDTNLNIINIDSSVLAKEETFKKADYDFVVSPDKGAKQRALNWACELDLPMLSCSKTRDPNTGALKDPHIPKCDLQGKKLLIVDDICDGGFTFIQLARLLKERGATVDLFVSHGIFSKGIAPVLAEVSHVYTTNSLNHCLKWKQWTDERRLTIFDCNGLKK
jgi:ribose-phosphate pyrophosphokinase